MAEQTNHNQNVNIPKSVTLGGVTYNIGETPELQQLVQAVSSVEKNKLYSKFDSLKSQIEELKNVQVVTESNQQPLDAKSIAEQIKAELKNELLPSLKAEVQEVVQPLLNSTKEAKERELKEYRESIINKNLATCIPELVKGNTREELDKSLQESIAIRSKYPSANVPQTPQGKVTDPTLQKQAGQAEFRAESPTNPVISEKGTRPSAPIVPPMQQQPEANTQPSRTKTMNMNDFAKNREALLNELRATFGGGANL